MPVIPIAQLDDPRLNVYRHLKLTNETRGQDIFIAEGEKLVERLLDSQLETISILAAESHADRLAPRIPPEIPLFRIAASQIDELIGFNFHRGVLACGRRPPNPKLESLWSTPDEPLLLVLCPDIKDPENLGTIIRISAAFGVRGMLVSGGADPYSRRVLRVSMGNVFRMPIVHTPDWPAALSSLQQAGIVSIATVLSPQAELLRGMTRPSRMAIALGSEGYGLPPEFVQHCDRQVTIPMADGVDSLNVAIAAGIFLHHFSSPVSS